MQHASPATTELPSFQQAIATNGWAVTAPMFDAATIAELRDDIAPLVQAGRGGARNLLDEPRIAAGTFLRQDARRELESYLAPRPHNRRSSPAAHPTHGRVIHIEYASQPLAPPLVWHRQVA